MVLQEPHNPQERSDPLIRLLGDCPDNRRREIWLWFFLAQHGGANYNIEETDHPEMSRLICQTITSRDFGIESLSQYSDTYILGKAQLNWITEDPRMCNWLSTRLCARMGINFHFYQGLSWRENAIALLDKWIININEKASALHQWQSEWSDQLVLDKKLDWLKRDNELEKCAFAWEWLVKSDQYDTANTTTPKCALDLIDFLDSSKIHSSKNLLSIDVIRKNWTQRAYRKKQGDKKQYNFILTGSAIKRLDKFRRDYDLSRAQILEILLQAEEERNGQTIKEKIKVYKGLET